MIYTGQLLTAIIQQVSFKVNSLNSLIKFIKVIFITEYTDTRLLQEVGYLTESGLTHSDSSKPSFLRKYFLRTRRFGKKTGFMGPHASRTNNKFSVEIPRLTKLKPCNQTRLPMYIFAKVYKGKNSKLAVFH